MTNVIQNVYPKDLTMSMASNHIEREKKLFVTAEDRIFVPDGGPFYSQSLILKDNNGVLLKPSVDYKLLYLNEEATIESGRDVVAVIWIMKETLPYVMIDYRVVGGAYGNTVNAIMQEITKAGPIQKNVDWNINVYGKPSQYPAAPHYHTPNTFTDWSMVYVQLEGIRKAIITGDDVSWESHYNYVDRKVNVAEQNINVTLTNYVTKTALSQAISGLDFSVDLSGYYTVYQTDAKFVQTDNRVNGVASDLAANYYTKLLSDARYPLTTSIYSRLQSDARYALKTDVYTKGESNDKYLTQVNLSGYQTIAATSTLEIRLNTRIDNAINAIPDVNLSNYYTRSETFNKNETYSRTQTDTTFARIGSSYTTTESNNKYPLKSDLSSINQTIADLRAEMARLTLSTQMYKVGDIYVSGIAHKNTAEVTAHLGYGTWKRYGNGEALVTVGHEDTVRSSQGCPLLFFGVGRTTGSYDITLRVGQMPAHGHDLNIVNYRHGRDGRWASHAFLGDGDVSSTRAGTKPADYATVIGKTGESEPVNNVQPSIVVSAWIRLT